MRQEEEYKRNFKLPSSTDVNVQFAMVPLKALSDQVYIIDSRFCFLKLLVFC